MQVDLYNMAGEVVGKAELSDEIFGVSPNEGLLHQAVVRQLANQRQGNAATKTRGMVSGGGKKPYKQKGTGRARQGTTRAPHFRGGGVVFGPHPRSYRLEMPKKMRRAALRSALSTVALDGRIRLLETLEFSEAKTREATKLFAALAVEKSALVVTPEANTDVVRSVRNIHGTRILPAAMVNVLDVMKHHYLVLPVDAARRIEQQLGLVQEG
jgi:large subunit ribosomal protein L4